MLRAPQIERLLNRVILLEKDHPEIKETGTNLKLQGTGDLPMSVGVGGNSDQKQYQGYNEIDLSSLQSQTINGITLKNEKGKFKLSGTATENAIFNIPLDLILDGEYTFSLNNNKIVGTSVANSFYAYIYDEGGSWIGQRSGYTDSNSYSTTTLNQQKIVGFRLIISSGVNVNGVEIAYQMEKGKAKHDFEPYVGGQASPNIKYKQNINNVEGNVKVDVESRNRFNLEYINTKNFTNIFTVTDTGVNIKNSWGTPIISANSEEMLKTFKPNTAYTMKAKCKVISFPSNIKRSIEKIFSFYRPVDHPLGVIDTALLIMKNKVNVVSNTEECICTFETPDDMTDVKLLAYCFYGNNDGSETYQAMGEIEVKELMLVEGIYTAEDFPDYVKHQEHNIIFPLKEGQKLMLGDYLAEDGIHHKRGQYVFTGEEQIIKQLDDVFDFNVPTSLNLKGNPNNAGVIGARCNCFIEQTPASLYGRTTEGFGITTSGNVRFRIENYSGSLSDFVSLLVGNYIEYELVEEIIEPYTPKQQKVYEKLQEMQSYYDLTYVTGQSDNAQPILTVNALKSLKSIQNEVDTIKTLVLES